MKRPLVLAIAIALTAVAGCTSQERVADAPKPQPAAEEKEEFGRDARADAQLAAVADVDEGRRREQDASKDDAAPAEAIVLSEAVPMTVAPPPPAPEAPPAVMGKTMNAQRVAPAAMMSGSVGAGAVAPQPAYTEPANRENYADLESNPIQRVAESPVSTFSIDVDSGSYANVRRMLVAGSLPPSDAVRAEEMINYFDYGYAPPATAATPFSVHTELAAAPWNPQRTLLLVGIKGFEVAAENIPAANLVFLIDTSGSMQSPDKIDLLKQSFAQMVESLRPQDRVSIVAYAGSAGLVLPSTPGSDKGTILAALEQLAAGGSTNGGEGIELAYATAKQHFIDGGVNRVILATDGDFNVGTVDIDALKTMVAAKRETGIALTTLGFGTGNYNDETAEQLADIGNGNHAYIDTLAEGRKVMVEELSSTMMTIAKDVKIQMEFNPAVVAEYRLIGYENRKLRREDFNNDKIDAGEIGAGHDVTALYELALVGSGSEAVDPLRYGGESPAARAANGELGFLRLRYKAPDGDTSKLIERPIANAPKAQPSERLEFAAAVAAFADELRGGANLGTWTLDDVALLAQKSRGKDADGYRGEFVALVEQARALKGQETPVAIAQ